MAIKSKENRAQSTEGVNDTSAPTASPAARKLFPALILLITAAVYIGALRFQFVYDDQGQIVDNPALRSWRFIPQYFTGHVWTHLYQNAPGTYYRPFFLLWLFANQQLFGPNPTGWHSTTIVVHLLATFLVYKLARKLTRDEWAAAIAALIFGLHPVHIEAVAWISGVTDSLLTVLSISSFLLFLRWRDEGAVSRLAPSLLLYALAMLTKETALVLPLIIFAYVWIFGASHRAQPGRRPHIERAREGLMAALPFLVLTLLYLVARSLALKGLANTITPLPLSTIILTWPQLLWFYVRLLVWPVGLSAFYETPYVTSFGLMNLVLPALGVAAIAFGLSLWARRSSVVAFAALWMVLPILPLLNLRVFQEGELAHDRYLYLPSVGFCILVALALRRIKIVDAEVYGLPIAQLLATLLIAGALALATSRQNLYWASDLQLYTRARLVAPRNNVATNNLAKQFFERGRYPEAIELYREVVERKPDFWLANYNLGYSYYRLGQLTEADQYLQRAIRLDPRDADQYVYLGLNKLKMGRPDEAEEALRRAISLRPDAPGYHFALGVLLKQKNDLRGALEEFKSELRTNHGQEAARAQAAEIESQLRNDGNSNGGGGGSSKR